MIDEQRDTICRERERERERERDMERDSQSDKEEETKRGMEFRDLLSKR